MIRCDWSDNNGATRCESRAEFRLYAVPRGWTPTAHNYCMVLATKAGESQRVVEVIMIRPLPSRKRRGTKHHARRYEYGYRGQDQRRGVPVLS